MSLDPMAFWGDHVKRNLHNQQEGEGPLWSDLTHGWTWTKNSKWSLRKLLFWKVSKMFTVYMNRLPHDFSTFMKFISWSSIFSMQCELPNTYINLCLKYFKADTRQTCCICRHHQITIFDLISALRSHLFFQNCIFSFENSLDPDQLASDEASWLRSTLFFIDMMIFFWSHFVTEGGFSLKCHKMRHLKKNKPFLKKLHRWIDWKSEVCASMIYPLNLAVYVQIWPWKLGQGNRYPKPNQFFIMPQ